MLRRLPLAAALAAVAVWVGFYAFPKGGTEMWLVTTGCPPDVKNATYDYYYLDAGRWVWFNTTDKPLCYDFLYLVKIRVSGLVLNKTVVDVNARLGYTYKPYWASDPQGRTVVVYDAPDPMLSVAPPGSRVYDPAPFKLYEGQKSPGLFIFDKGGVFPEADLNFTIDAVLLDFMPNLQERYVVLLPPYQPTCQNVTTVVASAQRGPYVFFPIPTPSYYIYYYIEATGEETSYPTTVQCLDTLCLTVAGAHTYAICNPSDYFKVKFYKVRLRFVKIGQSTPPVAVNLTSFSETYNIGLPAFDSLDSITSTYWRGPPVYWAEPTKGYPYAVNLYLWPITLYGVYARDIWPLYSARPPPPNYVQLVDVRAAPERWPYVDVVLYRLNTDWLSVYSTRYASCSVAVTTNYGTSFLQTGPFPDVYAWPFNVYAPWGHMECAPYGSWPWWP